MRSEDCGEWSVCLESPFLLKGSLGSMRFLKSLAQFSHSSEFHLNSALCFQNEINLHWKPSTGVVPQKTIRTTTDLFWWKELQSPKDPLAKIGATKEKLAQMIDSLNENLMENCFFIFFLFFLNLCWRCGAHKETYFYLLRLLPPPATHLIFPCPQLGSL